MIVGFSSVRFKRQGVADGSYDVFVRGRRVGFLRKRGFASGFGFYLDSHDYGSFCVYAFRSLEDGASWIRNFYANGVSLDDVEKVVSAVELAMRLRKARSV